MGDTIDGPRTMVVHSWYTSVMAYQKTSLPYERRFLSPRTDLAMMSSGWLESFALPAPSLPFVKFTRLFKMNIIRTPIPRHLSRIGKTCSCVSDPNAAD